MKTKHIKRTLEQWKSEFPYKFDHHSLDADLTHFQLWGEHTMLTGQLSRMDAISGIKEGRFFVISGQAVGYVSSLTS